MKTIKITSLAIKYGNQTPEDDRSEMHESLIYRALNLLQGKKFKESDFQKINLFRPLDKKEPLKVLFNDKQIATISHLKNSVEMMLTNPISIYQN